MFQMIKTSLILLVISMSLSMVSYAFDSDLLPADKCDKDLAPKSQFQKLQEAKQRMISTIEDLAEIKGKLYGKDPLKVAEVQKLAEQITPTVDSFKQKITSSTQEVTTQESMEFESSMRAFKMQVFEILRGKGLTQDERSALESIHLLYSISAKRKAFANRGGEKEYSAVQSYTEEEIRWLMENYVVGAFWEKIKRIWRSLLGEAIDKVENPELILKQNIRDMESRLPEMNAGLANILAHLRQSLDEQSKLQKEVERLKMIAKEALKQGKRDAALVVAEKLNHAQTKLTELAPDLVRLQKAFDQAQKVKAVFEAQIKAKSDEAMAAIRHAQRAEWQKRIAETMESFRVTDIAGTHEEMIQRLNAQAAHDEARLEVALGNLDEVEIEAQVAKDKANASLEALERELGLTSSSEATAPEDAILRNLQKEIGQ